MQQAVFISTNTIDRTRPGIVDARTGKVICYAQSPADAQRIVTSINGFEVRS